MTIPDKPNSQNQKYQIYNILNYNYDRKSNRYTNK